MTIVILSAVIQNSHHCLCYHKIRTREYGNIGVTSEFPGKIENTRKRYVLPGANFLIKINEYVCHEKDQIT